MWTQEQEDIRALAREFAEGELRPSSSVWDGAKQLDDEVFTKLSEVGFLGMLVPEEQGGLDFDVPTYLLVLEELAWGDASVALSVAIHNGPVACLIGRYGTDSQRTRWLPAMAAGEVLGAFALSEPDAGSDAGAVATVADVREGGWTLNGSKRWITNGGRAGVVVLFAQAPGGLSAFLVEPSASGYVVGAREATMGLRASETVSVTLDGVEVGPESLLGEAGKGLAHAIEARDLGRTGIAAQAVGVGHAAC